MAISLVSVGAKILASPGNAVITAINTLVPTVALMGQTGLIPASAGVTGGGASATVGVAGTVTFSTATSVSVFGAFSATYDRYRIEIDVPTTSVGLGITFQLIAGVTVATAANYDTQTGSASGAVAAASQNTALANWVLTNATTQIHFVAFDLIRPFTATPTLALVQSFSVTNPMAATDAITTRGVLHRLSTSYDGFKITASAGNFTGTIRIYGINLN